MTNSRFTPASAKVFNLAPSSPGRSSSDAAHVSTFSALSAINAFLFDVAEFDRLQSKPLYENIPAYKSEVTAAGFRDDCPRSAAKLVGQTIHRHMGAGERSDFATMNDAYLIR
jgi:hypothetical protein